MASDSGARLGARISLLDSACWGALRLAEGETSPGLRTRPPLALLHPADALGFALGAVACGPRVRDVSSATCPPRRRGTLRHAPDATVSHGGEADRARGERRHGATRGAERDHRG